MFVPNKKQARRYSKLELTISSAVVVRMQDINRFRLKVLNKANNSVSTNLLSNTTGKARKEKKLFIREQLLLKW